MSPSLAWEALEPILAILGIAGVSLAGIVGATYALFRLLGERWIDHKFAQRLETYRSEQAREMERLRHKINGAFDRTRRLHDREFEALPEVWGKLVEAKSWANSYIAAFKQYADVGRMTAIDLDEFLEGTQFSEGHKREIKLSPRRQDAYMKIVEGYRYADVMDKLREASSSLSKNGIFIIGPLRSDMQKMISFIHAAVIEHQVNEEHDVRPRHRADINKLRTEGETLFESIESAVIERLWSSTTVDL